MDRDPKVTGKSATRVWAAYLKCGDVHPNKKVSCDLYKGHKGAHKDYDELGRERLSWEIADDLALVEITTDTNTDPQTLVEWARAQNPKVYKRDGVARNMAGKPIALSDRCNTSDRKQHKGCTEPWCECPCHEGEDITAPEKGRCPDCQHLLNIAPYHNDGCVHKWPRHRWIPHVGLMLLILKLML